MKKSDIKLVGHGTCLPILFHNKLYTHTIINADEQELADELGLPIEAIGDGNGPLFEVWLLLVKGRTEEACVRMTITLITGE